MLVIYVLKWRRPTEALTGEKVNFYARKKNIVDNICNEEGQSAEEEPGEPKQANLRRKTICNKEKAALFERVITARFINVSFQ